MSCDCQHGDADDAAPYWASMSADKIPSKPCLHEAFNSVIASIEKGKFLDLGCGDGRITAMLAEQHPGFDFLGMDVNSEAISAARGRILPENSRLEFRVGDITSVELPSASFAIVLLQLVLSVVGDLEHRKRLLRRVKACLIDGGQVLLSVSGASGDINAEYAELYRRDEALTGEAHSYFSRAADGSILYPTHHFTEEELLELLKSEGFEVLKMLKEHEASSRRPDQAAWFFYVVARSDIERCQEEEQDLQRPSKRARRMALAPGSEAFQAAVSVGLSAMQLSGNAEDVTGNSARSDGSDDA